MKQVMWLLIVLAMIVFFSSACGRTTNNTAVSSTGSQSTIELTSTFVVATASASPNTIDTTSATETVNLFTQSDGTYQVKLTPRDFVDVIDNPYFPLPLGAKWEYEISEANGSKQKDTLEVLKEKRNVNGVQATVVRDTVSSGDQILEDTYDWFVQDKYGNVWYVGEAVDNYVGGVLSSHSGSWEWGVDGAQPGIIMWADPSAHKNEQYRQEYYIGRAEDLGQVLGTEESLTVPFGAFDHVVKTLDTSAIETGAQEHKFYAPGIGLLKELDLNTNEEMVLMKMTPPVP